MNNSGTIMDYFGDLFDPYGIVKSVQNVDVEADRSGAVSVVEHEDGSCKVTYVEGNGFKHLIGCVSARQFNSRFSIADFEWELGSNADYASLDDKGEALDAAKDYMAKVGPLAGRMYRIFLKSYSNDIEFCLLYAQSEGAIWAETVQFALDKVVEGIDGVLNKRHDGG